MTQPGAHLVSDGYLLGYSPEEHERLLRQGRTQEPATRRVFHAVGLRPGWTCLDIGCGQGCSTLFIVVHVAQGFEASECGGVAILGDGVGLIES